VLEKREEESKRERESESDDKKTNMNE